MTRTAKIMVIMFFCLTGLLTVEQKAASAQSTLEKNVIYGQDKIGTYQMNWNNQQIHLYRLLV